MTLVFITADGRKVLRQPITATSGTSGATTIPIVTSKFETPNGIAYILQVNLSTTPATVTAYAWGSKIVGSVVGMTVTIGSGGTVSGEVLAVAQD